MAATILTYEDLEIFKKELFEELNQLLNANKSEKPKKWMKSKQVRELLQISNGTLMTLRINGTIPYTRIGGAILYDSEEINKILKNNTIINR